MSDDFNGKIEPEWYRDSSRVPGWNAFVYALPHASKNHDGWSLRNNNAVVSDGATPLSAEWGADLYHWVNTVTALFAENGSNMSATLESVWAESIRFANTLYPPSGFRRTMGCSQVRINNHMIEIFSVGDTKVLLRKVDGNFIEIFDPRLARWEERADALIAKGELTGEQAAWHNRLKVNQLDGYFVVADEPNVGKEAYSFSIPEREIDNIIISSDGLWRLFEGNPEKMFEIAQPLNPQTLDARLAKQGKLNDDLTFIRLDRN